MALKTLTDKEKPTTNESVVDDKELRKRVMQKVTVHRPTKVDIRQVGNGRFRVNVWAETGPKTEDGWTTPVGIVQSFYHID